ncbi:ras-related protein Rab-13-like isoform X5 [Aquila chrysaetos chrysaetos]|uniref:ras-related protein Rab-13-like isoform X5 n=1 Tax=Aquila chrysaetos chrysaetos TaxID=223781 RepID=UPI001177108F|nr:ras-related protein Rab-13-like isoform X5 [Aquila chrysaetos chrysaetos]
MVPGPGPGPAAGPPPPAPHTHPAGGGGARSLTAGRPAALRPPPRPGRHSAPAMAGLGQGCAGKAPLLVKIVMAGESCVGKTSIVRRYTEPGSPPAGAPTSSYLATIGIDFKVKPVTFNGTRVKLQIWDTAGQERFHTLSTSYFRGAQGFVLVYDITNLDSFRSITSWMKDIHEINRMADSVGYNAQPQMQRKYQDHVAGVEGRMGLTLLATMQGYGC